MTVLDRLLSGRQSEPHPGWSAREWRACETAERWSNEGRDDDARKLLSGNVTSEKYADYLAIVHPPEPPAPAPEPGEVTRLTLTMPGEFDPADPAHVGRMLAAATRQSPGQVWQPESAVRDPETGRWTVVVAVEPDDEPSREEIGLAADAKPADAPKLAAWLESQGRELTSFEPFSHRAASAMLFPFTAKLRTQIGAYIKTPPWDISVALRWKAGRDEASQYEVSTVNITAPLAVPAEKRRALWLELARDLIPQVRGTTWWVDDRPQEGRVILRRQEDPLGAILPYPWDEPISVDGVPFAVAADGHQITVGLIERNLLLGGSPGSGKSGGGTALLCGISRLPHAAIIGIDPKRVELAPWRPRMSYVATQEADVSRVLGAIVEEMERRYEFLEENQRKKITPDMLTDEMPLLVVVVDELADIVSIGVTKEELEGDKIRATRIRRLIAKGRAAAISVIALTQKPQSDVVPTALRDLIQLRVSYATTTAAMTDTILGAGASQNGGLAHEIPASLKGVCYIIDETDRNPSRGRTFWVPDEDVAGLAERVAHLRIALPWLTADEPPYSEEDGERPVRRTPQSRPAPVPSEIEVSLSDLDDFSEPEPPAPADDLWS